MYIIFSRKNKARRRRIDEILRIHFNNSLLFDDDKDASRSLSPDSDDLEDDSEEVDTRWQDGSDEATEDYDCDDTTGREDEATDDVRYFPIGIPCRPRYFQC